MVRPLSHAILTLPSQHSTGRTDTKFTQAEKPQSHLPGLPSSKATCPAQSLNCAVDHISSHLLRNATHKYILLLQPLLLRGPFAYRNPQVSPILSKRLILPMRASCHRSAYSSTVSLPEGAACAYCSGFITPPHSAHRSLAAGPPGHSNFHHQYDATSAEWPGHGIFFRSPVDSNVRPWLRTRALGVKNN